MALYTLLCNCRRYIYVVHYYVFCAMNMRYNFKWLWVPVIRFCWIGRLCGRKLRNKGRCAINNFLLLPNTDYGNCSVGTTRQLQRTWRAHGLIAQREYASTASLQDSELVLPFSFKHLSSTLCSSTHGICFAWPKLPGTVSFFCSSSA